MYSLIKGKLEIPWNGISMANHLVMSEEFLDSLLPMYEYLEPSLKIGILFSLMQMKRRDLKEKILKASIEERREFERRDCN